MEIWEEKWTLIEAMGGGGQGATLRVHSKGEESIHGVLKKLRNNRDMKSRLRMNREVTNLKLLAAAGASVPIVLDHNTELADDGRTQLYFVMSFIPGQTLNSFVKSNGTLSAQTAVEFCQCLCRQLALIHQERVTHRDLKPDNIIVEDADSRRLVIIDFGLSSTDSDEQLTQVGETFRNKFLDLPENVVPAGAQRDVRSDITALAALLYYCLTDKTPGHLRDQNDRPPHRRPGHTLQEFVINDHRRGQLDALFDRAFSVRLDNRFRSTDDFRHALERISAMSSKGPRTISEIALSYSEEILQGHPDTLLANASKNAKTLLVKVSALIKNQLRGQSAGVFKLSDSDIGNNLDSRLRPGHVRLKCNALCFAARAENFDGVVRLAVVPVFHERQTGLIAFRTGVAPNEKRVIYLAAIGSERRKEYWKRPEEIGWYGDDASDVEQLLANYITSWIGDAFKDLKDAMLK